MSTRSPVNPRRLLAITACCMALLAAPAHAERVWPKLTPPAGARTWSAGDAIDANGLPMRVGGFVSDRSLSEVTRFVRHVLGGPVVANHRGDRLILGRAEGGFYLTVQLEPAGGGTRALVAVTDLQSAAHGREQARAVAQRWLQRLPAGSRVLSHTAARDGGRLWSQWVYGNGASAALNGQALKALLHQDGLRLEHESAAGPTPGAAPGARLMLFKGAGREATAVIGRLPDGRASVVLSTVTALETME